jgi:hypothetical protein
MVLVATDDEVDAVAVEEWQPLLANAELGAS